MGTSAMASPNTNMVPVAPRVPAEGSEELGGLTIADSDPLAEFLKSVPCSLTEADYDAIVTHAIALLRGFYVHRPVKRKLYGANPVGALLRLQKRISQIHTNLEFHKKMCNIFATVRDLHTNYLLPAPFDDKVAFLPFNVEACFRNDERIYIISRVSDDVADITPGAEVVSWNGQPIETAIQAVADHNAGSNVAAHHARGVSRLTFRALAKSPPPSELKWVTVGYRTIDQERTREFRASWRVVALPPQNQPDDARVFTMLAVDIEAELARRTRKRLYRPDIINKQKQLSDCGQDEEKIHEMLSNWESDTEIPSRLPDVLEARIVGGGMFGSIRIRTFNVGLPSDFIDEFERLLTHQKMPKAGLIIDVRDNGGGAVEAAEGILQLLTPNHIDGQRMQFINTLETLRLCQIQSAVNQDALGFGKWVDSIARAVDKTGNQFSAAYPLSEDSLLNGRGQCYYGPVVLIVNALSYSATDLFAAGFKDHKIGDILGADENTGAGGGNVFTYDQLRNLINQPVGDELKGVGFRVALRRSLRVGAAEGTELEDFGIAPIETYRMKKRDVLGKNEGLIEAAMQLLGRRQDRLVAFQPKVDTENEPCTLNMDAKNIDRLDVFADDRPLGSFLIEKLPVEIPKPVGLLTLRGYRDGQLVALSKLRLHLR
jgi:Peptidase family S41